MFTFLSTLVCHNTNWYTCTSGRGGIRTDVVGPKDPIEQGEGRGGAPCHALLVTDVAYPDETHQTFPPEPGLQFFDVRPVQPGYVRARGERPSGL